MEMITANDLYYLPRLKNMEAQYEKLVREYKEMTEVFNEYLASEQFPILEVNMLADKMRVTEDLIDAIFNQRITIRLQTLN